MSGASFKTLAEVAAENGRNWETVLAEREAEIRRQLEAEWAVSCAAFTPLDTSDMAIPEPVSPFYVPPAEFFHAEAVRLANLIVQSRFVWCALGVFLGAAMVSLFNAFAGVP